MHLGPHLLEIVYSIHNYGKKKKSENCKITEWMRLEGMSRGYLVQWPEEAGPSKAGCPGPSSNSK